MNVVEELRNYYTNPANESVRKYIQGLNPNTNKVLLQNESGVKKEVSMDELKNNLFDFEKFELKDEMIEEEDDFEMIEELDEPQEKVSEPIEVIEEETNKPYTMQDLKNAVDAKDINNIDKILGTFAVNPNTGLVDIDRAIGIVTKNTINQTVKCINENQNFESDLSKYSVDGKLLNNENMLGSQNNEEKLNLGFNNILLLVEVAKQKGTIYSAENIERARKIFTTQVKDGLNIKSLEKPKEEPEVKPEEDNVVNFEEAKNELVERKSYVPTLKPDNNIKKAGFADVFILTVIVLVYAAIIINLIMKLK
jgi:hypothetical protein